MNTTNNFLQWKSFWTTILLALLLTFAPSLPATGYHSSTGHHSSGHHSSTRTASGNHHSRGSRCASCTRNAKGKIKRSREAKRRFERQHPCPSTGKTHGNCPGYVVDHRKALAEGGADVPSNMEWQTTADAKAKDKWERKP